MTTALADTGAGPAHLVDAYDLCQLVRTAYDPAVAAVFDQAHAAGEQVELDWTSVGPVAQDASWAALRHDSCWSVWWTMTQPPRGLALSSCLTSLVGKASSALFDGAAVCPEGLGWAMERHPEVTRPTGSTTRPDTR